MFDVPAELWALICGHLDKPQLCSVRLVSPCASYEAARNLFQSISLNTEGTSIGNFIALVEQSGHHSRIRDHIKQVNFGVSLPPQMSRFDVFRRYYDRADWNVRKGSVSTRLPCLTGHRLDCGHLLEAFRKLANLNTVAIGTIHSRTFEESRELSSSVMDRTFLQICRLACCSNTKIESFDVSTAATGLIYNTIFERPQSHHDPISRRAPYWLPYGHSWNQLAIEVSQDLSFLANLKHFNLDIDFCTLRAVTHPIPGQSQPRSWLKDALYAMASNLEELQMQFGFSDGSYSSTSHLCFAHRLFDATSNMSDQLPGYCWEVCISDTTFLKLRTLRLKNVILTTGAMLASFLERHKNTLESVHLEPWTCIPRLPCPPTLRDMTPQAAPHLLRLVTFVSSGAEARLDYEPGKNLLVRCQRHSPMKEMFCEVNAALLYRMYKAGMTRDHAILALMYEVPVTPVISPYPLAIGYIFSEDKEVMRRTTLATTKIRTISDLQATGRWREDVLRAQRRGQQDPSNTSSFAEIMLWYSRQPKLFNPW